ncbi:hypothetical protein I4F81_011928 [Pyropia yezoensis]|uniref:Uncharacterized protein n=1 Tax=Pyropia yezoensis TaxID=2788 RepID=A0ACC3CGX7_PYRYE|nr:hypothetical protein I4F81_011928 [Neopyropia yezoensis]
MKRARLCGGRGGGGGAGAGGRVVTKRGAQGGIGGWGRAGRAGHARPAGASTTGERRRRPRSRIATGSGQRGSATARPPASASARRGRPPSAVAGCRGTPPPPPPPPPPVLHPRRAPSPPCVLPHHVHHVHHVHLLPRTPPPRPQQQLAAPPPLRPPQAGPVYGRAAAEPHRPARRCPGRRPTPGGRLRRRRRSHRRPRHRRRRRHRRHHHHHHHHQHHHHHHYPHHRRRRHRRAAPPSGARGPVGDTRRHGERPGGRVAAGARPTQTPGRSPPLRGVCGEGGAAVAPGRPPPVRSWLGPSAPAGRLPVITGGPSTAHGGTHPARWAPSPGPTAVLYPALAAAHPEHLQVMRAGASVYSASCGGPHSH